MELPGEAVRRRLVLACAGLACVLAFLSPLVAGCQRQSQWAVMAAAAVLLGAVALVARGLDANTRHRADPVMIALACVGGAWALQLLPLPAGLVGLLSPARLGLAREVAAAVGEDAPGWLPLTTCLKCTRDGLVLLVACGCAFYAASRLLARPRLAKAVLAAAVVSGALLAAWGIVEVARLGGGRLTSTYVSPNRFAGFMALAGAAAVGLFIAEERADGGLRPRDRFGLPRGWWWLAAAGLIETALVLTLSRLGIASAAAAALLAFAVFGRRTRARLAAVAGMLLVLAANAVVAVGPVLGRYSVLFEAGRIGSGRPRCWAMALPLVADFPVFGSGAGTFRHVFPMYQGPTLAGTWDYAHNDWLNVLADGGLVSVAALGAAAVLFYRRIVPLGSSRDPAARGAGVAAFMALTAAVVHSVGDYPLRQPANALVLALVCGLAWGRAGVKRRRGASGGAASERGPGPRWFLPACVGAALFLVAATVPLLVRLALAGDAAEKAGRMPVGRDEKVEREGLERRLALLERAARLDPWDARVRYEAARTRVRLVVEDRDDPKAAEALRAAEHDLSAGRAVSPLDPYGFYLSAVIDWRPGSTERADRMMAFALRLAPASADVGLQVGGYFLRRWRAERDEAEGIFGIARLARGDAAEREAAERDELFRRASRALGLAARSPRARRGAVALALECALSPEEVDAALAPGGEVELALARALAARGDHARARRRYERALDSGGGREPRSSVRAYYAASLMALGMTEDALAQFDAALAGAGREELAATVRALGSLRAPPEGGAAVADFWAERAAPGGPLAGEREALRALGRAEIAAGRERKGFEHLLDYAERAGDAGAFAELSRLALGRGENPLAESLAARAARLDPGDASHGMLLARVRGLLGDGDGARAALGGVLARDPGNVAATQALAALEIGESRHDVAIRAWRRLLDSGGDAGVGHEELADVYLAVSDRAAAKRELAKALEARPGDERLRAKLEGLRPPERAGTRTGPPKGD
ncbi:MAG: O-antigen ligase family protein [Planctomycetota bacterium]|jgi:tetratricopeptide (TPR) repeat protein